MDKKGNQDYVNSPVHSEKSGPASHYGENQKSCRATVTAGHTTAALHDPTGMESQVPRQGTVGVSQSMGLFRHQHKCSPVSLAAAIVLLGSA